MGDFAFAQDHRNRRKSRKNAALNLLKFLFGHICPVPALALRLLPGAGLRPLPEQEDRQGDEKKRDHPFRPCLVFRRGRGRHQSRHGGQDKR